MCEIMRSELLCGIDLFRLTKTISTSTPFEVLVIIGNNRGI